MFFNFLIINMLNIVQGNYLILVRMNNYGLISDNKYIFLLEFY